MPVTMRANRLLGLPPLRLDEAGTSGSPRQVPSSLPEPAAGRDLFGGTAAYMAVSRQAATRSSAARYVTGLVGGETRALGVPAHVEREGSSHTRLDRAVGELQAAVSDARSRLGESDLATFDRIQRGLDGDRRARFALDALLVSGRLTSAPRSLEGRTLLETLDVALATSARAPLAMSALVGDAIQMIADPASIIQGLRNTCTAASLEVKLASEDPAEYVRLIGALASGQESPLRGGETLRPLQDSERRDDSGRCDASRLFQDAVIQLQISEPGIRYVNPQTTPAGAYPEIFLDASGKTLSPGRAGGGMTGSGQARTLSLLSGQPRAYVSRSSGDPDLIGRLDRELSAGRSVPVTVHIGGHEQLQHAITLTARTLDGSGDPVYAAVITGRSVGTVTQTIPADDLVKILVGATLPSSSP